MTSSSDATEVVSGLNVIGDIKQKMHALERLKEQIEDHATLDEREQVRLVEYKQELEKLHEEKLAHVAELRLIHSDIDVMEGTVKQAEIERKRGITQLHSLFSQYVPMLTQINFLRLSLGLSCLQDETLHVKLNGDTLVKLKELETEQKASGQSPIVLFSDFQRPGTSSGSQMVNETQPSEEESQAAAIGVAERWETPRSPLQVACGNQSSMTSDTTEEREAGPSRSGLQFSKTQLPTSSNSQPFSSAPSCTPLSLQTAASLCRMIRQQAPPMKACSSCQQQIHRNAPICPLCKARSRSQHSKRSASKRTKLSQ